MDGDKIKEMADFMKAQNALLLEKIGSFNLKPAWEMVEPAIHGMISDGKQSPPSMVVRRENGVLDVIPILGDFISGERGHIVSAAISSYFTRTNVRIVGAAFFSEAYFGKYKNKDDLDRDSLGKGDVEGSQEVILGVCFDGLNGECGVGTAPIIRQDGAAPDVGEWTFFDNDEYRRLSGDLIQGLAVSVTSTHVMSFAKKCVMKDSSKIN